MNNDTIKRSDAIKALDNAWINGTSLLDANEAVKQLNDLPSADRPQGDFVSKRYLLAEIDDLADEFSEVDENGLHSERWCGILDSKGIIVNAPSVSDRPQEWIPCSERLPEEEGEYLVTAKKYAFDSSYYDVQIAYCSPNKKWFRISNCEIVAWMPRPKPWKGADNEVIGG